MKTTLLIILLLPLLSHAAIYKRVLANGEVIYTDKPAPRSQKVELSPLAATMESQAGASSNQSSAKQLSTTPPPPNKVYQLTITSPLNDETIRNNTGLLNVSARLQPISSGTFELLLNNEVKQTQKQPRFSLKDVPRGTHHLQIQFKDNSGKLIASSPLLSIHMHRASALNRGN